MPSTVIFKQGFPSLTQPVETSASIGADGLITGSAVFLVAQASSTAALTIGAAISPTLFSGLGGVGLQGLFIETRSLEKRNGLTYLRLGVVGALNPPIVELKRDVSPRGFSKSAVIGQTNVVFSFDYQAESYSASTVLTTGQAFALTLPVPKAVNIWNQSGTGAIRRIGESGRYEAPPATFEEGIVARPRVLTTETSEQRPGIIRITKTSQFIYE